MITIPHTLGQHFAYALGRLGVLEAQLLKTTDIDRLLGAHEGAEAVKMLRDIDFVAVPEADESFQGTLNATTKLLKENVEKMSPESHHFIFNILWIEGDRAQLSYELKEKHSFVSSIAVKPEPPVSSGFELELEQSFSKPQEIDDVVAASCNEEKMKLAKRSGSSLIQKYVQKTIELEELRTKMRTEDSDLESIAFEKEGMAQLGELLVDMQRIMLGPDALFSYAARTLNHIQLLKVLLTGKVNNLPIQEIKSLLPPLL
jgi:hypothetical protein